MCFASFAVTFPAQGHGQTPRRVGRFWPESFESMNLGLPNQIASANAGKRLGFAGKSRVGLSPRPGVAEFHRWLRHDVASTTAERGLFLTQPCLSRQVFYGSRRLAGGANYCQRSVASQTVLPSCPSELRCVSKMQRIYRAAGRSTTGMSLESLEPCA